MRRKKWSMYLNGLQGHPSVCKHGHIEDFEKVMKQVFPEPGKILVIGCAEGLEVQKLKEMGYEATGITLGKVNVEFAKLNYPDVSVVVCDMHDLEFPLHTFDYVVSIHSFEHAYAPFIHCLEVNTVLKEKGKWLVILPKYNVTREDGCLSHHHPNVLPEHLHVEMFKATGFNVYHHAVFDANDLDEYYSNGYFLEKSNKNIHDDVRTTLEKRKQNYNWDTEGE